MTYGGARRMQRWSVVRLRVVVTAAAVSCLAGSCSSTTADRSAATTVSPAATTAAPTLAPTTASSAGAVDAAPVGDMNATLLSFLEDPRMEAAANGTFHTFIRLVGIAGLTSTFNGPGPMALFPPTDEAFARRFTPAQLEALTKYQVDVAQLINFHAANGIWPLSKVIDGTIPTMAVNELHGSMTDGVLRLNNTVVRAHAVRVENGYLYPVNDVLMPPGFQVPAG